MHEKEMIKISWPDRHKASDAALPTFVIKFALNYSNAPIFLLS